MIKYKRIFVIPFVIVVGALASLQIPVLRTPLLRSLIDYALQGQGLSLTFNNLSGIFPFYTSWGSIIVSDEQGLCLETNDVEISWSPWHNTVNFISARVFHVHRLPNIPASPQGQGRGLVLTIPSLIIQEIILPQNQTLKDVKASIGLTADSAHLKGIITVSGVIVEGQAEWERTTKAGVIQGTAKMTPAETLRFNLPYQWDGNHLHIKDASVEGKGLKIQGHGIISQKEQTGQLHFQMDHLTPWADYFHLGLEGDGVTGTAVLTNRQEITGHIETNHIAWKDLVIVACEGDYHYSLAKEKLETLKLTCGKIQWRDFFLTEIQAQVHQTTEGFNLDLQVADALTQGKLQLSALVDRQHVRIQEALYRKGQKDITLVEALVWYYDELWPRSAIHIKTDKGGLRIDALKQTEKAQVTIQRFPLDVFSLFMENWPVEGTMSGTGWLDPQSQDFPYQLTLKGADLHFSNDKSALRTNVSAILSGNKDYLQWKVETTGNPTLQFQSEGGIEWATYALNAQSNGVILLDIFNKFLGENDRMAGQMKIQLQIKGSVEQPLMNGQWRIHKGRFEDGDIGLILKDIEVQGQINNSLLTLSQVTAKDVADGSVTGRGTISFQNGWTPSFDLRLELEKITLAQTDEIKGLASGPIFLKGPGAQAKLFGTLDVLSLTYDFGEQKALPRTLQLMDEPDKETSPKLLDAKSQDISRPIWIPLNLVLNLKKPVVIRGEGLKSDWQGNITLAGDLKKSYLVGHLQLVGGGFEFFGKKLKLTAGTMDFDKGAPNDPKIMLRAMREAMSLIIYFQIAGRASNPAFSFSSTPPLPVEEIVARLLFDKSLGEMSSMQGLQVASALASLQTASGLNIFNKLRNVFGLDVLEFKQSASNPRQIQGQAQGAISLGKQVSEQVYVRAEQGLGADSSKVGVEVKVTPQLSIEADVGGPESTGAGLNWSKRY